VVARSGAGVCRFGERLSHKPVHNLVHQLVGGITLVSNTPIRASIGTVAPDEAMLGRLLPPSLNSDFLVALRDGLATLGKSGWRFGDCSYSIIGTAALATCG
jgi:hypothetical protein